MKRSLLKIMNYNDVYENPSKLEGYKHLKEWDTPYLKVPKKEKDLEKFSKKMHKKITAFGEEINANLEVIRYTHTHYPDRTANHNVIFYKSR